MRMFTITSLSGSFDEATDLVFQIIASFF